MRSALTLAFAVGLCGSALAGSTLGMQRQICLGHLDHTKTGVMPVYEPDFAAACTAVDAQIQAGAPADAKTKRDSDLNFLERMQRQ